MNKNYFYILIFTIFSFVLGASHGFAQAPTTTTKSTESIDGLNIFPNPVNDGVLYIDTKLNASKEVTLYNILGKKILSTKLSGRELLLPYNISSGVYILSIKEKEATSSRKIVIK